MLKGKLKLYNTIEEFNAIDLDKLLNEFREEEAEYIKGLNLENQSSTLDYYSLNTNWFIMVVFCDLKKHSFQVKVYQPSQKVCSKMENFISEKSPEEENIFFEKPKNDTSLIVKENLIKVINSNDYEYDSKWENLNEKCKN